MRKLLLAIAVSLIFLTASVGNAAWTVTETSHPIKVRGSEALIITLACISDASGKDYELTTSVIGFYLYDVRTVPGSGGDAPTAAYDLDVEDELNFHLMDIDSLSTTATQLTKGSNTVGIFPHMSSQPSVVLGTLGNLNTNTIYLRFVK